MPPTKHILIVEDERAIAADLERTLQHLGYDVAASVASGEEAIETAAALHPDLILMDIRLHGKLDGIDAACAIRSKSDTPIVYLTAYADDETIRRATATSPIGYVIKPVEERELRAAIELGLSLHEAERVFADERARRRDREQLVMRLSEALRARDDFLDIAAHELKTPLAALRLHLDAMEGDGDGDVKRSARLAAARHQAVRLSRVVDAVMDVSRSPARRSRSSASAWTSPRSCAQPWSACAATRREPAPRSASSATVRRAGSGTAPRWIASSRTSSRTPSSTARANRSTSTSPRRTATRASRFETAASASTARRSSGSSRGYERAVSPRHFGGLGLGLFVARRFAEAHGGSISVESRPGEGATFTVTLPKDPR